MAVLYPGRPKLYVRLPLDSRVVSLIFQLSTNAHFSALESSPLRGLPRCLQTGGLSIYTFNTFCAQVLAVYGCISPKMALRALLTRLRDSLEQNVGIVAANVLPMGPLFSRRARQMSRPTRRAPITRRIMTRPTSRGSSRPGTSRSSSSKRSSFIDLKRSTTLIIEGPRRVSFDMTDMRDDMYGLQTLDEDRRSIRDLELGPKAWPNGIIKTVSVEVIEEVNPDHNPRGMHSHTASKNSIGSGSHPRHGEPRAQPGRKPSRRERGHSAKGSEVSIEQDWETMLRQGPM